jgi:hypothetical protein
MKVGELIKKLNKRDKSQIVYYVDKYGKHEITDVQPMLTKNGSVTIIMNGDGGRYNRKTEPQRDCFLCKWLGEVNVCGRCRNRNLFAEKDEPQTNCNTCKYDISEDDYDLYDMCEPMVEGECRYEPKTEP